MEDANYKLVAARIRKCASDLLWFDDLLDCGDDEESWELLEGHLRLKSIFLCLDLNRLISIAGGEERTKAMAELSNKLFDFMEELDEAVKSRSNSLTQLRFDDVASVLLEIIIALG